MHPGNSETTRPVPHNPEPRSPDPPPLPTLRPQGARAQTTLAESPRKFGRRARGRPPQEDAPDFGSDSPEAEGLSDSLAFVKEIVLRQQAGFDPFALVREEMGLGNMKPVL